MAYYRRRQRGLGAEVITGGTTAALPSYSQISPFIGPATRAIKGAVSIIKAPTTEAKVISGLTTAGTIGVALIPAVGPFLAPLVPIVSGFAQRLFGKRHVPHAVREALERNRGIRYANQTVREMSGAQTLAELHAIITSWGSGYTGGTHAQANMLHIDDAVIGVDRGYAYSVVDFEEFRDFALDYLENPAANAGRVRGSVQLGVSPHMLTPMNRALERALLNSIAVVWQREKEQIRQEQKSASEAAHQAVARVKPNLVIEMLETLPISAPFYPREYLQVEAVARTGEGKWRVAGPGDPTLLLPGVWFEPATEPILPLLAPR